MSSSTLLRIASKSPSVCLIRSSQAPVRRLTPSYTLSSSPYIAKGPSQCFSTTSRSRSSAHGEETFDEFNARYENEFNKVEDVFELQRNLNNSFSYDLVPTVAVCTAALRAARRVHDYPTAVRVFEGIKVKVENKGQYEEYLKELQPIREELGIDLAEDLYPDPMRRHARRFEK